MKKPLIRMAKITRLPAQRDSFWMDVIANILTNISNCGCLLLSDVIIGILKEGMDLVNYVIILGKSYLRSCRHKQIKPSISHFERILEKKYETEKYIAFKSNRTISFRDKWKSYEEFFFFFFFLNTLFI